MSVLLDFCAERRFLSSEVRVSPNQSRTIQGYAAKFGCLSLDLGGFREKIAPAAFSRSLRSGRDIRCLANHDANQLLGRVSTGTLRLEEDNIGLRFMCELPATRCAEDVLVLVRRGDLSQCSFGFTVRQDDWEECRPGHPDYDPDDSDCRRIRTLLDVDLQDVGPVTFPAYEDTTVAARAAFPNGMPAEVRHAVNHWQMRRNFREELQQDFRKKLIRSLLM